uniref:Cytochrome c oxidase subunit 3 n=1 Tax=Echinolaelaps echidninus TaxID=2759148 RepID=A0AB74S0W2_9ACAR
MVYHPFHIVENSPWPIIGSFSSFMFMSSLVFLFHSLDLNFIYYCLLGMILIFYQWWRDVVRESTYQGCHSMLVKKSLKLGMMLFILSEVFFFISFFWSYFHNMLAPDMEIGMIWPPKGVEIFNPYQIPLLNTIILLSSGFTVTLCHHSILNKNFSKSKMSLMMTIMLGVYFSFLQWFEYNQSYFCINDSIYGTVFFLMTGFHGLHVLIGTVFLGVNFFRLVKNHYSDNYHFGFEASAWYWHFVDVVWLFLYVFVYWWIFN